MKRQGGLPAQLEPASKQPRLALSQPTAPPSATHKPVQPRLGPDSIAGLPAAALNAAPGGVPSLGQDAVAGLASASAALRQQLAEALQRHFGFPGFRGAQEEAILAALTGRDVFVLMPTGRQA